MSKVIGRWTAEEFFAGLTPPTNDDVPTTVDGTPLDTPEKVIEHLGKINAAGDRRQRRDGG